MQFEFIKINDNYSARFHRNFTLLKSIFDDFPYSLCPKINEKKNMLHCVQYIKRAVTFG